MHATILFVADAPKIGEGVRVARSSIPEHGLGLFAERNFRRGEILTWYDGFVVPKDQLWLETLFYQPGSTPSHSLDLILLFKAFSIQLMDGVVQVSSIIALTTSLIANMYNSHPLNIH